MLVPSPVAAIGVQQVPINMDQTTFEESIIRLSEIFGIDTTLLGISDLPKHKFNLTLEQATFEQATKEAIRKAGLQSHALVWDPQKNTARIWIFRESTIDGASRLGIDNNMETINPEEFAKLEPAKFENFRMMTQEEYDRLEPESQENYHGMTPEEFENLEPTESENFKMMTQEEYDRLEPESQENYHGMTPEEFSKLEQEL